jgi:hypothetical protein
VETRFVDQTWEVDIAAQPLIGTARKQFGHRGAKH